MIIETLKSSEVTVSVSDMLVATPDTSDPRIGRIVSQALQALRLQLHVDAVFVAEVIEQQRVTRQLASNDKLPVAVGDVVPLEETFCGLMLKCRIPEFVPDVHALAADIANIKGAHLIRGHVATAITLASGRVYGTLCCVSAGPLQSDEDLALSQLRRCAKLVAESLTAQGVK